MKTISILVLASALPLMSISFAQPQTKISVLVWDEQQPEGAETYSKPIGDFLAAKLMDNADLEVRSNNISQAEQGLSSSDLKEADILIYWSHKRNKEIPESKAQEIAELVKSGSLALITLHSAHWSKPFMICMQEKAAQDVLESLSADQRSNATVKYLGEIDWKKDGDHERSHLEVNYLIGESGQVEITLERPNCVFPRCCTPVQPSLVRVINTEHPIVKDIPETFTIAETEMYDEPFGIPDPDLVLFNETWQGGEYFRSGSLWDLGEGQVFYFRPGHETYRVFTDENVVKILENAALWMGQQVRKSSE